MSDSNDMTTSPTSPTSASAAASSTPARPHPSAPAAPAPAISASKRRPALLALTGVVVLAGLGYGTWWALTQRHHEDTDNAYVQAPVVQLTPQVGGTVVAVLADDTDIVKAGQPLVQLDPADARLGVERAEAQLAQTVREVRTLYANNGTLGANVQAREADVARLQSDVARATDDVNRRRPLAATGAVGGEEMKHVESALTSAQTALAGARSALAAAREQVTSNRALTEGTPVEKHPTVERAAAALREALLAQQRTALLAPVSGQVARRSVQVGQRVAPGAPLLSIIPLDQVWVEANFKEVQLREMRIGQPVKLHADLYGSKVEYTGRVAGLGAGTGAAFALLPAQNATGNWIKVVQRVPVRIELDAASLAAHPLRVGLSMTAEVDVGQQTGAPVMADVAAPRSSSQTAVFDVASKAADERVREVIAANLGAAIPRATAASAQHGVRRMMPAAESTGRVVSTPPSTDVELAARTPSPVTP